MTDSLTLFSPTPPPAFSVLSLSSLSASLFIHSFVSFYSSLLFFHSFIPLFSFSSSFLSSFLLLPLLSSLLFSLSSFLPFFFSLFSCLPLSPSAIPSMFRGASLFLCLNWVAVVVWLVSTFDATDATVVVLVCLAVSSFLSSLSLSISLAWFHFCTVPPCPKPYCSS